MAKPRSQPLPMGFRPKHHEGTADEVVFVDRSQDATVLGSATVVAEHEHKVVLNDLRRDVSAALPWGPIHLVEIRLIEHLRCRAGRCSDPHDASGHFDRFAGQTDHSLDQVAFSRVRQLVQDDHVTAIRVVKSVRQLVHEDAVASVERCCHRLAFHDEVGQHEATDNERHKKRNRDDDNPIKEGSSA